MTRLGIYGGTFSPPHLGHYRAAEAFIRAAELDGLVIMPAFLPPHKTADGEASPEERLTMCRLAFGELPRTSVSDYEIVKGGKSYTYLTLKEFSRDDRELFFLVGTDMFLTLDKWKNPAEIFGLCTVALVRRECDRDIDGEIERKAREYKEAFGARLLLIDAEVTEVSSSELRAAIKQGRDTSGLLDGRVGEYISEQSLYGREFSDEELEALRIEIRSRLSEKRFLHTLGVERAARELAARLLPEAASEISAAALMHDVAKEISREEQLSILRSTDGLTDEDLGSQKLYHAFCAPEVIRRDFPRFATKNILSAVFSHTTGDAGMSVFDEIVFVADFIEDGREYSACRELRERLYASIENGEDPLLSLHRAALDELLFTKEYVLKKGGSLNSRSERAINYFAELLNKRDKM